MKLLFSIFDYTGNASKPYREDPNWEVVQIDIQHGIDFLTFDYKLAFRDMSAKHGIEPKVGIIAMVPCTHDAVSGAKHFKKKDQAGISKETNVLMDCLKEMIDWFKSMAALQFWQIENPRTRLHNRFPWIKPIRQKFNPCDFAGYDPTPDNSRYNKDTWLFGNFNIMEKKHLPPLSKEYPGFKKLGGKSLKTKNARSITPLGFCYAFYQSNH